MEGLGHIGAPELFREFTDALPELRQKALVKLERARQNIWLAFERIPTNDAAQRVHGQFDLYVWLRACKRCSARFSNGLIHQTEFALETKKVAELQPSLEVPRETMCHGYDLYSDPAFIVRCTAMEKFDSQTVRCESHGS